MSFYAFNPLAGGWLTSRYKRDTQDSTIEAGSRFDPNRMQGKMYRARFWNDEFFTALEGLRAALPQGQTESETALRWMMHHSQLKKEFGDKVIIGASSLEQLEMNLKDFEKSGLSEEVVQALEEGWKRTRGVSWKYYH
jgi:aflatoxin B1 aldehyde reductase